MIPGDSAKMEMLIMPSGDPTSVRTEQENGIARTGNETSSSHKYWSPSGSWWKDLIHFTGPGWFVSIAYVDPGNYQADIQSGALSRYSLLSVIWWTSLLSLYVQILCVRLAFYGGLTLAEAQARHSSSDGMRYLNWFLAEISVVITDLPEVIGIGISCNIFFDWPYWVGVLLSLLTTMVFLATLHYNVRILEMIIASFVGIMGVALFVEMDNVGVHGKELLEGWTVGVKDLNRDDIFAVLGVVGAVVMPHNLYLHTAACQSRAVSRDHVEKAVFWCSIDPILPVIVAFFINVAVVSIAAESVHGTEGAEGVGLTNFCDFFKKLAGCSLWAIALLAAGQSSAITTTYTGQYVMDGYLNVQLPIRARAIVTRLVAITPCIIISILLPNRLNQMVNIVNASLSFLLPFAFTPLVKFNCNEIVMGEYASKGCERYILHFFAFSVWLVNAIGLSVKGGGFFGEWRGTYENEFERAFMTLLEITIQMFYFYWNWNCIKGDIVDHFPTPITGTSNVIANEILSGGTNPSSSSTRKAEEGEFA